MLEISKGLKFRLWMSLELLLESQVWIQKKLYTPTLLASFFFVPFCKYQRILDNDFDAWSIHKSHFFSFQTQLRFCLNKVAHNGVGRVEFGELSEGNGPFTIRLLFEKSAKKLLSFDIALHLCWGSAILLPYFYF